MTLWDPNTIKLFLDISTYCNAGCPQCHRTNPNGLGKADWLPLIQWSLDDFKKAFPPKELEKVTSLHFCGTWGDPIMNKDILEIVKYSLENSFARISFATNGSIRNEDFWWELGVIGGKRLHVVFDIDGINQEMHETYRRFTSLEKILNNMHIFSQTNARATSQTVLFKHNENYQEEIKQLCKEWGSSHHSFVISDRFPMNVENPSRDYVDEKGNKFTLYRAKNDSLPSGRITGGIGREHSKEIRCTWGQPRNEIVISADGQVFPCCYHQNPYYWYHNSDKENLDLAKDPIYVDYRKKEKQYNVFHRGLNDILNDDFFTKILPESMKSDNPIKSCERNCSKRLKYQHQIRQAEEL